ncbi:MAG: cytochrome c oxidase subunit III, partial [Alphaproteobacteria bacterium]|nr:cytochrome c oxidase subunit III [Alphaproteobacteria bacterium]
MSVMGLFFISIFSFAMLWLARQGVFASHWLEEGDVAHYRPDAGKEPPPPAKVGLAIFLAVAGCLFSLLAAAFFMRG